MRKDHHKAQGPRVVHDGPDNDGLELDIENAVIGSKPLGTSYHPPVEYQFLSLNFRHEENLIVTYNRFPMDYIVSLQLYDQN